MPVISSVIDDFQLARSFIDSLNPKLVRQRFSSVRDWKPDHVELITVDGTIVAMADCLLGDPSSGAPTATAGLLAKKGFGVYAVKGLLRLKERVAVEYWFSTLRQPTDATIGISRTFFDETYDQGAWEIANALALRHGPEPYFRPITLLVSKYTLRRLGLPPIKNLDTGSVAQILSAAATPGQMLLTAPSGDEINANLLMTLAFDLLDTPMRIRQDISRLMILGFAAMAGHEPSPWIIARIDKNAFGNFHNTLYAAAASAGAPRGKFGMSLNTVSPMTALESGLKKIQQLPGVRQ